MAVTFLLSEPEREPAARKPIPFSRRQFGASSRWGFHLLFDKCCSRHCTECKSGRLGFFGSVFARQGTAMRTKCKWRMSSRVPAYAPPIAVLFPYYDDRRLLFLWARPWQLTSARAQPSCPSPFDQPTQGTEGFPPVVILLTGFGNRRFAVPMMRWNRSYTPSSPGLPPLKWSSIRYGFEPIEERPNGQETAYSRRDCCEAASG